MERALAALCDYHPALLGCEAIDEARDLLLDLLRRIALHGSPTAMAAFMELARAHHGARQNSPWWRGKVYRPLTTSGTTKFYTRMFIYTRKYTIAARIKNF